MKRSEQNHEKQSLSLQMCHHGEASLFGARHKGLGSTEAQCGLKYQLNSETKRPVGSLWSVLDPWGPLIGVYWHGWVAWNFCRPSSPLWDGARVRSQYRWLRSGLDVAQIAFHPKAQTSGMWSRLSDKGANFPTALACVQPFTDVKTPKCLLSPHC